jgi:hypothetical protein
MGAAAIFGFLMDAALGGLAVATAFQKFREGRPADETKQDAAAEFTREMLAQMTSEQEADDALAAWLATHG